MSDMPCATKGCPNVAVDGMFCKKCAKEWDIEQPEQEVHKENGKIVKCVRCGSTNLRMFEKSLRNF